ncbi:MAG: hypothetical protein ACRD2N_18890 [Vicinamibacterales bacterium]
MNDLRITRHIYLFGYPFTPKLSVDFYAEHYGSTSRRLACTNDGQGRRATISE